MQPIPIVGGSYADDALPWSAQDTVNWLPVTAEMPGTRSGEMLRTPPGLKPFVVAGTRWRGLRNVEGAAYGVSGEILYRINSDASVDVIGTIPGRGLVSMTHNQINGGNELVIGTGDAGYVYNTATDTLTQITDDGFPGFLVCDYINSLIVGIEPGRRYWFNSALADALSYNTLERYESEAAPDRLRGLIVSHLETWLFNERTIEVFENTGAENALFENKRIVIEIGCAATNSVKKLENSIVFLGHDGRIYQTNGYQLVRISTHAIEQAITGLQWHKAFAFIWEDRGHKVYYLTFPDGKTWGFDFAVRQWHRRETEGMDRWRLSCMMQWNNRWYGGAYNSGVLYELDWDYALDGCDAMVRERTTPALHADQNRVQVDALELVVDTGSAETACVEVSPSLDTLILEDAPLLYWKLNETAGTQVIDYSGNGYHGTYEGSENTDYQRTASGIKMLGTAVFPDGAGVRSAVEPALRVATSSYEWAIEALVTRHGNTAFPNDAHETIAGVLGDTSPIRNGHFQYQIRLSHNANPDPKRRPMGQWHVSTPSHTVKTVDDSVAVVNNQPYHIVMVGSDNGSGYQRLKLYVNGALIETLDDTVVRFGESDSTAWFNVGGVVHEGSSVHYWCIYATIAHVALYNKSLGADRVLAHAQAHGVA
jgi:hypothetical protein